MPSVAPLQGNFNGGEVSTLIFGRVDEERYKTSLALSKNWLPTLPGPLHRRPGTVYVANAAGTTTNARLIPFVYSTLQAYVLEFGSPFIRIFDNYGLLTEILNPFGETDIPAVRFTQSADVLYLVHPSYAPQKLIRYSNSNWQILPITFLDGPYYPINSTPVTLTPGATSGTAVTVTLGPTQSISGCASSGLANLVRVHCVNHPWQTGQFVSIAGVVGTTEANTLLAQITVIDSDHFDIQGTTFVNAYVSGGTVRPLGSNTTGTFPNLVHGNNLGSLVRVEESGTWGWGVITAWDFSAGTITVNVKSAFGGTSASKSWRVGLFTPGNAGDGVNYPSIVSFHQDRLCFSGTPTTPQRIDGSKSSDYENFAPSGTDGTVSDDNSVNFSLNASDVNANQWLVSDEQGLLSGSTGAEWFLQPSSSGEALTPTNVNARRTTRWGSAAIQALLFGKGTIFVQRGFRKIRELVFSFYINGYMATDLTELAEHITGTGVNAIVQQTIPFATLWGIRNDGALVAMAYDRNLTNLRVAWSQHVLGGQSDSAGSPPVVLSAAVIPSPDGTKDDLWLLVKRWINGADVVTIEYLSKMFEDTDLQQDAFFLDCGATYNVPLSVAAMAVGSTTLTCTVTAHGLSTGDKVRFDSVIGVNNPADADGNRTNAVNAKHFQVTRIDANSFSLDGVDATSLSAYVGDGEVRKLVTTISGLSFLEGETVSIYADGAVHPPQVVSSGAIALEIPAAVVAIGLPYNSDGQMLRLEAGASNGTSLGKTRRTHRVGIQLFRSLGLKIGFNFSALDTVAIRNSDDASTQATSLFTGIVSQPVEAPYDFENQFCFRVSDPVPATILSIMPMMVTQDRK